MAHSSFLLASVVVVSTIWPIGTVGAETQAAHELGLSLGRSELDRVGTDNINPNNARQNVPFYKEEPVQSGDVGSDAGFFLDTGISRITSSQSYSSGNCDREGFNPEAEARSGMGEEKWEKLNEELKADAIQKQLEFFDQECEGINFLSGDYQTRPRVEIGPEDGLHNWTPPADTGDQNSACSIEEISFPPEYESEFCFDNLAIEKKLCEQDLIVTCRPPTDANCATGGIIPHSVSVSNGSYRFRYENGQLVLANDITATNSRTSAAFTFRLGGLDRVQEFRIQSINSDNWVGVEINGRFLGTHSRHLGGFNAGSDRLQIVTRVECSMRNHSGECIQTRNVSQVQYGPNSFGPSETGDRFTSGVNVNMIPYLREGDNVIRMYVINGRGPGNGYVYINARQQCPPDCDYRWNKDCAIFENARVD